MFLISNLKSIQVLRSENVKLKDQVLIFVTIVINLNIQ